MQLLFSFRLLKFKRNRYFDRAGICIIGQHANYDWSIFIKGSSNIIHSNTFFQHSYFMEEMHVGLTLLELLFSTRIFVRCLSSYINNFLVQS